MTSLDDHSFHLHSVGAQFQSQRKTAGIYTISNVGREKREKQFISHEHSKVSALGRQSPEAGPNYNLPSTLDLKHGVGFAQGKSAGPPFLKGKPEDGIDSNAELKILVDSQKFKYARDATMLIGTNPRGGLKDAELIKNHSAAFFARDSPGPCANGDTYGPSYEFTKKRMAFAAPFATKLPCNWQRISSQPDNVGPGIYPRKDNALGKQNLSHRRNEGSVAFSKAPKFEKPRNADSVSLLDAAKSSLGKQVLSKNRSEGAVGFSKNDRDKRARTAICITKEDLGPKAVLPKQSFSMPRLPMERDIMAAGWAGVGVG